jgi:MFS family permease
MTAAVAGVASADRPETRLATRLAFLVAGFGVACWAPLVPYAKARLGADAATLGLVLLGLGIGSVIAMPITGGLANRFGARPVILAGGLGLCLVLPALALASTVPELAIAQLILGASLGTLDVAMNVHAIEVERAAPEPLMSGFHGLFSVGGLAGSAAITGLLSIGASPLRAVLIAAAGMLATLAVTAPRLLRVRPAGPRGPLLVMPHGIVLLLGALAFAMFLVEGAVLDWSALLLTADRGFPTASGGLGYSAFSVAMSAGRLAGDRVVAALGPRRTLQAGGALAIAGFVLLLAFRSPAAALAGFALIGLGSSNLVPVLFSAAGRQRAMPAALAVASLTTIGYAGALAGPALVGFVAQATSLPAAFAVLALLVAALPVAAGKVARIG